MKNPILTAAVLASFMLIGSVAQGATLFGATYDSSKTAEIAAGDPVPTNPGATVIDNTNFKFDGGSLDPSLVTSGGNGMRYSTADNFNGLAGTIELWFRAPDWIGFPRMELFSIFNLPCQPVCSFAGDVSLFLLNDNFGGRLAVDVDVQGANQWGLRGTTNSTVLGDGNWHHVAYEWDSNTNHAAIFLDGVLETDTNIVSGGSVDFTDGSLDPFMEIGSRQRGFDSLAGNIDDLRISDVALYNGQNFTPPDRSVIVIPPGLPGDYNGDGMVGVGDFPIWQDNRGSTGAPGIPGDGDDGSGTGTPDGVVDQLDYGFWVTNFGNSGTGTGAGVAVPEPNSMALILACLCGMACRRNR